MKKAESILASVIAQLLEMEGEVSQFVRASEMLVKFQIDHYDIADRTNGSNNITASGMPIEKSKRDSKRGDAREEQRRNLHRIWTNLGRIYEIWQQFLLDQEGVVFLLLYNVTTTTTM